MKLPFDIAKHEYTTKFTYAMCYGMLSSVALNFFWQPGHIYASGMTGIAQIITELLERLGLNIPLALVLYSLNLPLFVLAWKKISHKFTIFTFVSVTMASLFIQLVPETVLIKDPIICAIFGGVVNGFGIGLALKNGISSGGVDIISLTIRKKTGKSIGSIGIIFNAFVILTSGILFGWPYALYSILAIFVSGKVTDVVFTKQQKLQVMIVTKHPKQVIDCVQKRLRRGITIVHNAEGAFSHDPQTILFTIITRYEMHHFEEAMRESDDEAFVSIADNVTILGNFYDSDF